MELGLVQEFKYLGRILVEHNDEAPTIHANLVKARGSMGLCRLSALR